MKSRYEYMKEYIGESDYACLTLVGCNDGVQAEMLRFNGDGAYMAYIVDGDCEIPEHYELVARFENWMKVYDDEGLYRKFEAQTIRVFRAGSYGCIIQLLN